MKKSNYLTSIFIVITLLVSSVSMAEEHLPVSGKSYTIGSGSATDWTHKYETLSFAGVPNKLSFNFAYIYTAQMRIGNPTLSYDQLSDFAKFFINIGNLSDEQKGHGNEHMLYVEESADGNTWTTIWTDDDATSKETKSSGEIQLSKSTRYIRFHHSCNFSNSYTNIAISELKYVEDPEPATIDLGTAIINSGEVSATSLINWCNIAPLSVTCSNPRFTVTPTGFGNIDQYGSQQLTIRFTHNKTVGEQKADITISNGTAAYKKTIHVTVNTTKRQQTISWNPQLAATGFAMNVGEQYPDAYIPAVATAPSGDRVVYTSDNSDIIEVIADTALLAKAVGTVKITVTQAGSDEYEATTDTKLFTVTELFKQHIVWEQNLYTLLTTSTPVELTASATSGGAITYTSADESVVKVSGNILTVVGEGETYVTAHQAGGEIDGHEYLEVSAQNYVIVRNPASQCNGIALSQNSLTLNSSKKSQDYNLSGIPNVLTFTAKHGTKSTSLWGDASYSALIVEQYADIDGLWDWYKVYERVVGTDDTQSGNITLNESATKVRFRTLETGTDHTVSNIRVTRKKFMRTDVESVDIDIETNAIWTKTITVSHSNIDLMTVVAKQGLVSLNTSTLGAGCEDFGDDAFVASFTPMQKYVDYYDTIVITDGKAQPSTIEIPLHFYTRGLTQSINDFDLPETVLTTDEISFSATATSGLEVVYLSSDSTVAYVENNRLVILRAGIVDITAYQEGNDRYNSASLTKTVAISLTPIEIYSAPTASSIVVGQTLADALLSGGKASVEGSFAWLDPQTAPQEEGEFTFPVLFTPANASIYASDTTDVAVSVLAFKQSQTITWEDDIPALYIGDTYLLTATASSGLTVQFLSSDTTVAYVDAENMLVAVDSGEVTISAVQAGDDFYMAAETLERRITILPPPTTYSNFEASFCHGDSVEFAGQWYFATTQEDILLDEKNTLGGDSIVHLTLTVNPTYLIEDSLSFPLGQTPEWQGINLGTLPEGDTTLIVRYESAYGCDSIHVLYLTVLPMVITYGDYEASFCQGDSVEFASQWYNAPTQEDVLLDERNTQGGDSIVHLTVAMHPTYAFEDSLTTHQRMSDTWQDIALGQLPEGDTTLVVRYATTEGCDSVYTLYLTVLPQIITYGYDTIRLCAGERITYEGKTYRRPTKTSVLLSQPNQYGGDSIVELVVYVFPAMRFTLEKTIREKATETWQGYDLSVLPVGDTTLVASYSSVNGCDSVYTLHLSVLPRITTYGNDTLRLCAGESAEYEGKTYTQPTTDSVLLSRKNQYGCDSIVELVVFVFPEMRFSEELTIRERNTETWQGYNLSVFPVGDTTLVAAYTSVNGCDSVYTLRLSVLPRITTYGNDTLRLCAGETAEYDGKLYDHSTTDSVLLSQPNQYGCDSIVELVVYVFPTMRFSEELTIRERNTETWQDYDLSVLPAGDTTLVAAYTSVNGCDSVYTLLLTVLPQIITYGNDTIRFCEGDEMEYEGKVYDHSTTDSVLLNQPNQYGGDSIVVLEVYMYPVVHNTAKQSIYEGESLSWESYDLSVIPAGDTTLIAAYTSVNGCDSTYTLYLTVLPMVTTYGNDTIQLCEGEQAEYEGKVYTQPTVDSVKVSERNQFGGDSIVELVVYVFPTLRVSNTMTITEGDSVTWQGIDLSGISAGDTTLTVSYTSIHGCDSVYMLELTVNEAQEMALDEIDATQTAEKFFHNGQLYIRKNRHVYNLQGIKVEIED